MISLVQRVKKLDLLNINKLCWGPGLYGESGTDGDVSQTVMEFFLMPQNKGKHYIHPFVWVRACERACVRVRVYIPNKLM